MNQGKRDYPNEPICPGFHPDFFARDKDCCIRWVDCSRANHALDRSVGRDAVESDKYGCNGKNIDATAPLP